MLITLVPAAAESERRTAPALMLSVPFQVPLAAARVRTPLSFLLRIRVSEAPWSNALVRVSTLPAVTSKELFVWPRMKLRAVEKVSMARKPTPTEPSALRVTVFSALPSAASELTASTPPRMSMVCPAPPKSLTPRSSRVPGPDLMKPTVFAPSVSVPDRIRPELRFDAEAAPTAKCDGVTPVIVDVPVNSSPKPDWFEMLRMAVGRVSVPRWMTLLRANGAEPERLTVTERSPRTVRLAAWATFSTVPRPLPSAEMERPPVAEMSPSKPPTLSVPRPVLKIDEVPESPRTSVMETVVCGAVTSTFHNVDGMVEEPVRLKLLRPPKTIEPTPGELSPKVNAFWTLRPAEAASRRVPLAMLTVPVPKGPVKPPEIATVLAPMTRPPAVALTPPVKVFWPPSCSRPLPDLAMPPFWMTLLTMRVAVSGATSRPATETAPTFMEKDAAPSRSSTPFVLEPIDCEPMTAEAVAFVEVATMPPVRVRTPPAFRMMPPPPPLSKVSVDRRFAPVRCAWALPVMRTVCSGIRPPLPE